MSHGKVVELLEFYKPRDATKVKIDTQFAGTHHENGPKYPSFFDACRKGRVPGDVGWNIENNEHAFAARSKTGHVSAIADKRHNRVDGFAMKGVDYEVKHNFMRLPGRNTGDPYFRSMGGQGAGVSRTPSQASSVVSGGM